MMVRASLKMKNGKVKEISTILQVAAKFHMFYSVISVPLEETNGLAVGLVVVVVVIVDLAVTVWMVVVVTVVVDWLLDFVTTGSNLVEEILVESGEDAVTSEEKRNKFRS